MPTPSNSDPFKMSEMMTESRKEVARYKISKKDPFKAADRKARKEKRKSAFDAARNTHSMTVNRINQDQGGRIVRIENEDGTVRYGPLESRRNKKASL